MSCIFIHRDIFLYVKKIPMSYTTKHSNTYKVNGNWIWHG